MPPDQIQLQVLKKGKELGSIKEKKRDCYGVLWHNMQPYVRNVAAYS